MQLSLARQNFGSIASRSFVKAAAFASSTKAVAQGQHARNQLLKGADLMADTVGVTLGPRGRNVIIEQTYGNPRITKDGVTVAKAVEVSNPLQNVGASMIKSVAHSTNENSGDGTTTATILARDIFKGGCEAVAAGLKPIEVLKGIRIATTEIRTFLQEHSKPVTSTDDIYHVATVSANGDKDIGSLISKAMEKVGKDGSITVAEGRTLEHDLQFIDGYEYSNGYVSAYFMTDPKSQRCELDNAYVLISEDKISSVQSILPILEQLVSNNAPLLIICDELDSEVLAALVLNRLRGGLRVCVTRAPGFGDYKKKILQDLAALTGGTVCASDMGMKLDNMSIKDLGRVKKALISKEKTLLLEGAANTRKVKDIIEGLKYQLRRDTDLSEYEKSKVKERLAKLSGGVAVIHVGGASEVEVGEIKDRVEDALCATRAAVESGVLPGGGSALLYAAEAAKNLKGENIDQDTGIRVVRQACQSPVKLIASNAGYEGAVVAGNLLRDCKFGQGFDAVSGEYVDMMKAGILDPTKVVVTALTDAASVASMMCTTEAAIYQKKDESVKDAAGADMDE
eukprot:Blabericola_migrator_1__4597@NODE_243_length_10934_cov_182_833625_g205_i0_p3_GENE_NODE_243_length_10934_cov_182_833625_g205_i0NODE_243_length_10934_cov_182_833625_g205_i0_p3_ORF_typecomplete_len568_score141_27Cpn60_TCP1/PF00118_24/2_4e100_NODE_243_length_10934_cov_182_833625_g205_i015313234